MHWCPTLSPTNVVFVPHLLNWDLVTLSMSVDAGYQNYNLLVGGGRSKINSCAGIAPEAGEACRSLDVVVGCFVSFWMRCCCALGVTLVGQPLLERFSTGRCILHLWVMALTAVRWSPKALETAS